MIEAYGAYLNWQRKTFFNEAIEFEVSDVKLCDLNKISLDALRVWTMMFFAASGYAQLELKRFKRRRWGLDSVVNNKALMNDDRYRIALVRAAEAKLVDTLLDLPPATRWKVKYNWALPPA